MNISSFSNKVSSSRHSRITRESAARNRVKSRNAAAARESRRRRDYIENSKLYNQEEVQEEAPLTEEEIQTRKEIREKELKEIERIQKNEFYARVEKYERFQNKSIIYPTEDSFQMVSSSGKFRSMELLNFEKIHIERPDMVGSVGERSFPLTDEYKEKLVEMEKAGWVLLDSYDMESLIEYSAIKERHKIISWDYREKSSKSWITKIIDGDVVSYDRGNKLSSYYFPNIQIRTYSERYDYAKGNTMLVLLMKKNKTKKNFLLDERLLQEESFEDKNKGLSKGIENLISLFDKNYKQKQIEKAYNNLPIKEAIKYRVNSLVQKQNLPLEVTVEEYKVNLEIKSVYSFVENLEKWSYDLTPYNKEAIENTLEDRNEIVTEIANNFNDFVESLTYEIPVKYRKLEK
ncbi:MAG: hypothetical protein PF569_09620 [Candidatus Woesearchaeota archaeon]|jgi:hypothetical protein|nr:hypothetical protein [Candidatus Woesearchaeota archaeon]